MKTANQIIRFTKSHRCEFTVRKSQYSNYRVDFTIYLSSHTTYSSYFYVYDESSIYSVLQEYYNGLIRLASFKSFVFKPTY